MGWRFFDAAAVEQANPGVDEIGGGDVSIMLIVLGVAIALWSAAAMALARRVRL